MQLMVDQLNENAARCRLSDERSDAYCNGSQS
jgi:hypothetical protein